jgi:hypothetical protein
VTPVRQDRLMHANSGSCGWLRGGSAALVAGLVVAACAGTSSGTPAHSAAERSYVGAASDPRDAHTPSRDIRYVKTNVSADGTWTLRVSYFGAMHKRTKALPRAALLQRARDGTCANVVAIVAAWTSPFAHSAAGVYDGSVQGGASNILWTVTRTTSADRRSLTIRFHDPRLAHRRFCAVDSLTLSHFTRYDFAKRTPLRPTN